MTRKMIYAMRMAIAMNVLVCFKFCEKSNAVATLDDKIHEILCVSYLNN